MLPWFCTRPVIPDRVRTGDRFIRQKNGTPKLFDKPVRDAGGDPTTVLRYADRMGMVKRANDERLRRSVRMGKLQTRCVVIEIEV